MPPPPIDAHLFLVIRLYPLQLRYIFSGSVLAPHLFLRLQNELYTPFPYLRSATLLREHLYPPSRRIWAKVMDVHSVLDLAIIGKILRSEYA